MMKKTIILGMFVLATSSVSISKENSVDCANQVGSYESSYCAELAYEKADSTLNSTYKEIKVNLSKEEGAILIQAQRGWLKYRDNHCELENYENRGTTGWATNFTTCKTRLTDERVESLKILE